MSSQTASVETGRIETNIPARLDRLPWAKFHWMVVIGLGTVWILDGLEVTIVGSIAPRLTEPGSGIAITTAQIGTAAAVYVAGACVGALFFGQLTDRFGRKKLFLITLALYIAATLATAASWTAWFFFLCRFFTGAGIGGEYSAINSAIDELIPARVRGRVDLIINGSYWVGAAAGSAVGDPAPRPVAAVLERRLAARVPARRVLGLGVLFVRRNVPESPRWLFIHGREEEAERIVRAIEQGVERETDEHLESRSRRSRCASASRSRSARSPRPPSSATRGARSSASRCSSARRSSTTASPSTSGRSTRRSSSVSSSFVPVFLIVFAVGNFLGPLLLGRLFDTVGRKPMIAGTYLGSAAVAALMAALFTGHALGGSPWTFQAFIFATFFLASAGASAAYLTVSEIFPMETRALAIAFFYAVGTGIGGIIGPLLFGNLIASGNRGEVATAFLIGAARDGRSAASPSSSSASRPSRCRSRTSRSRSRPRRPSSIARARARGTAALPAGPRHRVSLLLAGLHGDVSPAADARWPSCSTRSRRSDVPSTKAARSPGTSSSAWSVRGAGGRDASAGRSTKPWRPAGSGVPARGRYEAPEPGT